MTTARPSPPILLFRRLIDDVTERFVLDASSPVEQPVYRMAKAGVDVTLHFHRDLGWIGTKGGAISSRPWNTPLSEQSPLVPPQDEWLSKGGAKSYVYQVTHADNADIQTPPETPPVALFYDKLAPYYYLLFEDFAETLRNQGSQLSRIIAATWPSTLSQQTTKVLDVSCGIGTQSLALASLPGFSLTASDISREALDQLNRAASASQLTIPTYLCDMRGIHEHFPNGSFDVVMSADNSVPHLQTDAEILQAIQSMVSCARPGGGVLITLRDYDNIPRGVNQFKPYGVRIKNGRRYVLYQLWDFEGDRNKIALYVVEEVIATGATSVLVSRSTYYAIGIGRMLQLMQEAGLEKVHALEGNGGFYQPVLVGTRPVAV